MQRSSLLTHQSKFDVNGLFSIKKGLCHRAAWHNDIYSIVNCGVIIFPPECMTGISTRSRVGTLRESIVLEGRPVPLDRAAADKLSLKWRQ
jgi:hypothetical protein